MVYRASCALPCLAMVCPSNSVAMLAGAPGMLSRMAEMDPPATALVYTAPSRMRLVAGGM